MVRVVLTWLLMTNVTVSCSSSNSRRSSSRSVSPPTFSLPRGRGGPSSAPHGVGRGRGRVRGRRSRLSLGSSDTATSPEKKQPVVKRGGRKSLSSRLGTLAKKKGYITGLIDIIIYWEFGVTALWSCFGERVLLLWWHHVSSWTLWNSLVLCSIK